VPVSSKCHFFNCWYCYRGESRQ